MFASKCLGEGIGGSEGKGAMGVRGSLSGPRGGLGGVASSDVCK